MGEIASISPIDGQLITPNRQAMGVVRTGSRAISPGILCSPIVRNPGPWQRVAGPGKDGGDRRRGLRQSLRAMQDSPQTDALQLSCGGEIRVAFCTVVGIEPL